MKKNITTEANRIKSLHYPEGESEFIYVKQMTDLKAKKPQLPRNYEEAKIMCKARKRKERQESTGSVSQERKAIRSNSEERPVQFSHDKSKIDMRRVVSHEDFQKDKAHPLQEHNEITSFRVDNKSINKCVSIRNSSADVLNVDYEKQRFHERFAVPLSQRGKRANKGKRKAKSKTTKFMDEQSHKDYNKSNNNNTISSIEKVKSKAEDKGMVENGKNEDALTFLAKPAPNAIPSNEEDKEQSPSPVHTPISSTLDLSTLHQQIDFCEPIRSSSGQEITEAIDTLPSLSVASNHLLSSPRNSIMVTHRIYLDPNVPQTKTTLELQDKSPGEKKLKHVCKQINSIKKKIKKHEEEFQLMFGHKPLQTDLVNNKAMMVLHFDLSKLKKEYKSLRDNKSSMIREADCFNSVTAGLKETVFEIEKRLRDKRIAANRNDIIDDMSNDQLLDEKLTVQKFLLHLESLHGRPTNKEDRDLVRPLYDRYRLLKRMVLKISTSSTNTNELATINEHEAMDFISLPSQAVENSTEKLNPSTSTDSDTDISLVENLHNLTLDELLLQQFNTCNEKKKLRKILKEFENDFELKTGKKIQKDDKTSMANLYTLYKQSKAKLRLLDALVEKTTLSAVSSSD